MDKLDIQNTGGKEIYFGVFTNQASLTNPRLRRRHLRIPIYALAACSVLSIPSRAGYRKNAAMQYGNLLHCSRAMSGAVTGLLCDGKGNLTRLYELLCPRDLRGRTAHEINNEWTTCSMRNTPVAPCPSNIQCPFS